MDADRLAELERALLLTPFDATLRSDYAGALRAAGRNEDALAQFELLFQQSDVSVEHLLDAADCARRLGRTDAAARFVDLAESEPGFDRDDARVLLVRAGGTPSPPNDAPSSEVSGASEASEPRRSSELREAPIDAAPSDETHDEIEPGRERVALHSIAGGRESIPSEGELISISRAETVRFADVVGMTDLKKTIRLRIIEPFVRPGLFQRFRKTSPDEKPRTIHRQALEVSIGPVSEDCPYQPS